MLKLLVEPADVIVLEYVSESPALGTKGVHSFVLAAVLEVAALAVPVVVLVLLLVAPLLVVLVVDDGVVVVVVVVLAVAVEAEEVVLLPPPHAAKTKAADAVNTYFNAMMKPPKKVEVSVVSHIPAPVQHANQALQQNHALHHNRSSQRLITAPPKHTSPSYKTAD